MFNKVLVKLDEKKEERTPGGIIIPDTSQEVRSDEKTLIGTVVSVGEGAPSSEGGLLPMSVKVGDRVIVNKFAGSKVEDNLRLYDETNDIICVLENTDESN